VCALCGLCLFPCLLQRLVIAEALVQGVQIATIARNLRVSRSWASPRLIDHALDVIEDALQAVKVVRQWPSN